MRAVRCVLLSLLLFVSGLTEAQATLIDLNDFFADPTVTVAVDGSSAMIAEDPFFFSVLLSNDPGLGDPEVIVAAAGVSLLFDFDFVEGPVGEDDEFGAFLIDAGTGFSLGSPFEFFIDASSAGTVSFDLSGLVGTTLGLQFQLGALLGDAAFDSLVTISNVQLQTVSVPEPPTLFLFFGGLMIALFWCRLVPGRIEL